MARIETFFGNQELINLTASVGRGGVNLKDDVLIVQAMLKYALKDRPFFRDFKFCEPTGAINEETRLLIKRYQKFLRRATKVDIAVDGLIDRAIGEKPSGKNGRWTILYLNEHMLEARLLKTDQLSEFQDLAREFPQVHSVLDNLPVGSLNLALE